MTAWRVLSTLLLGMLLAPSHQVTCAHPDDERRRCQLENGGPVQAAVCADVEGVISDA